MIDFEKQYTVPLAWYLKLHEVSYEKDNMEELKLVAGDWCDTMLELSQKLNNRMYNIDIDMMYIKKEYNKTTYQWLSSVDILFISDSHIVGNQNDDNNVTFLLGLSNLFQYIQENCQNEIIYNYVFEGVYQKCFDKGMFVDYLRDELNAERTLMFSELKKKHNDILLPWPQSLSMYFHDYYQLSKAILMSDKRSLTIINKVLRKIEETSNIHQQAIDVNLHNILIIGKNEDIDIDFFTYSKMKKREDDIDDKTISIGLFNEKINHYLKQKSKIIPDNPNDDMDDFIQFNPDPYTFHFE